MKILHTADLHIERESDVEILETIIGIAENNNCDHILISGDLFENGHCAGIYSSMVAHILASFSGKVWIIPGNHDENLPEVMHLSLSDGKVFDDVEMISLDEDTDLLAIPYGDGSFTDLLLENKIPDSDKDIIAMMHGTLYRDDCFYSDGDSEEYFPIKYERLQEMKFTYTALGHYHTYFQDISEQGGTIVNPGSPVITRKSDNGRRAVALFDTETSSLRKILLDTPYYDKLKLNINFMMGEEEIIETFNNMIIELLNEKETKPELLTLNFMITGNTSMEQDDLEMLELHLKDILAEKGILSVNILMLPKIINKRFLSDPLIASILNTENNDNDDEGFKEFAVSVLSDIYTNEL
jgi:DNA repair exonuclease SbcCD nuclease subunit